LNRTSYIGRFAPSPTGPLHQGSLIAAAASYLDARAHNGQWLIRIEDIDPPREVDGATQEILETLQRLHMHSDQPVMLQSDRVAAYERALDTLQSQGDAYPCQCSRSDIAREISRQKKSRPIARHEMGGMIYPGTCRPGNQNGEPVELNGPIAWRLIVGDARIHWHDRPAGFEQGKTQIEALAQSVGDFALRRRDKLWSYQLAVVVDDADSGITDIVRGVDLADSNARQVYLRERLGLPSIRSLHFPVLEDADGKKVSKQAGAPAIDTRVSESDRISLLNTAIRFLSIPEVKAQTLDEFWVVATQRWRESHWLAG
jgi:glutamyl-Q tRNA(Asp) synthetase